MSITNLSRDEAVAKMEVILQRLEQLGSKHRLSRADELEAAELNDEFSTLADHVQRSDKLSEMMAGIKQPGGHLRIEAGSSRGKRYGDDAGVGEDWASRAAARICGMSGESRAVVSGSIDLPSLVLPEVVSKPRPSRLIDLLVTRQAIPGNAFEYFRQTVRTNNADVVADGDLKPTSVFTVVPVEDRCRVVAHLTEPIPIRLLADHQSLRTWLDSELVNGVLDALESQVVDGDGIGENLTGILATEGTTAVPWAGDVLSTLRSALTELQIVGVQPTAWALHPADAELVDLARWETDGGYLTGGYGGSGNALSGNIFGDASIQRVVSPSVPQGTAILADWSKLGLWVREGVRVDVDAGGELFTKNQAVLRAECRVGAGVILPPAFAVVELEEGS